MLKDFDAVNADALMAAPFKRIGDDWMLITGGTPERWNTMTASWGGVGVLWERRVCYIFVRPTRHTYEFLEAHRNFTLSFFDPEHRAKLQFCGAHSGRDTDKAAGAGLTVRPAPENTVTFAEAAGVMVARTIYFNDIQPDHFLIPEIQAFYPAHDYHRLYVGEILHAFQRKPK